MTEEGKEVARWQVVYKDEFELEHEMFKESSEVLNSDDQLELWLDANQIDWEAYCAHYGDETWDPWVYARE